MRHIRWVRRHISSKPDSCTEPGYVDAAGISVKVGAHYPGRSADLPIWLPSSRDDGMGWQKSAEGIVGSPTELKARTCNTG
jgi:hypothetical protein